MATREQLEEAIRRADRAGDADSVRKLGAALRSMNTQPTAPKPKSVGRQLLDNTINDVAGLAQGRASMLDLLATGAGKFMSAPVTLGAMIAEGTGHSDAGRNMRSVAHELANPATIGGAIEKIAPTPDTASGKVQRVLGQFLGGTMTGPETNFVLRGTGLIPKNVPESFVPPRKPGKTIPDAPKIIDDAKKVGVRVLTSDVRPPRTFAGRSARSVGEKIPYVGTGPVRQAQQAERVAAVKQLADDFGASASDDLVPSSIIDDVSKDLAARRGKELETLTGQKTAVINKLGSNGRSVPVDNTITKIDSEIARLGSLNSAEFGPLINRLAGLKRSYQGQSLTNIETLRRSLAEIYKAPELGSISKEAEKVVR
ncbi:MAG TPA: hypothetical protein VJ859_02975, partial [Allosphingosinicella sp.]|nr:hypothetical protein [Allosphingosinicella sp.]